MNNDIGTLIEPGPVAFSWGAPGWYVLAGVFLLLTAGIAIVGYLHHKKNKYRRTALSWLEEKEKLLLSRRPEELIYEAAILMKRVAISRYGRADLASIHDKAWIAFLNKQCKRSLFTDNDADWLKNILYVPNFQLNESDARSFLLKTRQWIKLHRYAL